MCTGPFWCVLRSLPAVSKHAQPGCIACTADCTCSGFTVHHAVSVKQKRLGHASSSQEGPLGWELRAECSEASLVLWYPEEEEQQDSDQACTHNPEHSCMTTSVCL